VTSLAHDIGDDAGEQRIVRAAQDEGVDLGVLQGREVVPGDLEQLLATGDPALDELDEPRARLRGHRDMRGRGEGVEIRPDVWVPSVEITPTRLRVALQRRRTAGRMTSTTGTS
jgi:hypothetical protein